jgi:hypothetical protein
LNARVSATQSSSVIVMPSTIAAVRDNPLSPFTGDPRHIPVVLPAAPPSSPARANPC